MKYIRKEDQCLYLSFYECKKKLIIGIRYDYPAARGTSVLYSFHGYQCGALYYHISMFFCSLLLSSFFSCKGKSVLVAFTVWNETDIYYSGVERRRARETNRLLRNRSVAHARVMSVKVIIWLYHISRCALAYFAVVRAEKVINFLQLTV